MPSEPIDPSAARTLPLYDPTPPDADGWHAVGSPGGYEWWYFDAEDAAGGLQFVAIFLEGFVFHPGYLRRYARYRSRPTRHAPPLPAEYPCAYFAVYEGGRVLAQFMTQVRPGNFHATGEGPEVRVGDNRLSRAADGSLRLRLSARPWRLTWRGPRRTGSEQLSADLTFTPLIGRPDGPSRERTFLSRDMTGAEHRWVIADPLCRVQGEIRLGGAGDANHGAGSTADGAAPRLIPFAGLGYHDHNFGTAPIGPGLRRWVWGRMLWEDHVLTFHYARPLRADLPDEVHVVEADAGGFRGSRPWRAEAEGSRRTALGLSYPESLRLTAAGPGPAEDVRLTNPRVIDAAPFYLRLTYDGRVGPRTGKAFCEVAYPHRLTWPVLGRMIEMSIEKP